MKTALVQQLGRAILNLQFKASRIDLEQKVRVSAHFEIKKSTIYFNDFFSCRQRFATQRTRHSHKNFFVEGIEDRLEPYYWELIQCKLATILIRLADYILNSSYIWAGSLTPLRAQLRTEGVLTVSHIAASYVELDSSTSEDLFTCGRSFQDPPEEGGRALNLQYQ